MTHPRVAQSPRVAALQLEMEAGSSAALDLFWREVTARGAPLIETSAGNDYQVLVTFLWRAAEPIENVVVVGDVAGWTFRSMTHLLDTDLWYETYLLRADTRTTYRFSINDPCRALDPAEWSVRSTRWQLDPLNPLTYAPTEDVPVSLLELPAAPPQPWITPRPGVPAGEVHHETLHSTTLDNDRDVWIYLPPGYTALANPYGLLVLFDGWAYLHWIPTPTVLDNLLHAGTLPPLVAILLEHPDRAQELSCSAAFADFVAHELMPWIHSRYHVTVDPDATIIGGSSLGGLAAAFVALRYPGCVGNVLAQDGAFWWGPGVTPANFPADDRAEWLSHHVTTLSSVSLRFYLEAASLGDTTPFGGPNFSTPIEHLRDILQATGSSVHYSKYGGGHEYVCWRGSLADGLIALRGRDTP